MASNYFDGLNYSLGNEDTRVEFSLLRKNTPAVLCVGGSGARVLPLIAQHPGQLDVIDISPAQLFLCELRIAAAQQLEYEEFLFLLGYRGGLPSLDTSLVPRSAIFSRLSLSPECREFWEKRRSEWESHGWIYLGRWEKHFLRLGTLLRDIIRLDASPLFEAQTLEEQAELYRIHWKPLLFRSFLRIAASDFVFDRLYRGQFSGKSGRRTQTLPAWKWIDQQFDRLLRTTLLRKNYFMQFLFLGKILYEEGLPIEAWRTTLEDIKKSPTQITYHTMGLMEALAKKPYDFYSLSDVVSYLDQKSIQTGFAQIHPGVQPRSLMILRGFLRLPQLEPPPLWTLESNRSHQMESQDLCGVYQFKIFSNKA